MAARLGATRLATLLGRLAREPIRGQPRRSLCRDGREFVIANYSREVLASRFLESIEAVANRKAVPAREMNGEADDAT